MVISAHLILFSLWDYLTLIATVNDYLTLIATGCAMLHNKIFKSLCFLRLVRIIFFLAIRLDCKIE